MNPIIIFVCFLTLCAPATANAQQLAINPPQAPATANPQQQLTIPPPQSGEPAGLAPRHCYAMNYVLKELDGTKVINQRSYVLNTLAAGGSTTLMSGPAGDWAKLRVGNRVPVFVHSQEKGSTTPVTDFNYIDIGVNMDNRVREFGNMLTVEVTADITSVAADTAGGVGSPPTVRQVKGTTVSVIIPGKPSVVFAADDPGSQHRFELQVTATLVR